MRNYFTKHICLIIIFLGIYGPPLPIYAKSMGNLPSQLTLVYHRPKENLITQWLVLVYTEAFKRMDIDLNVNILPSLRTGIYSNTGKVDGELGRINDYNSKFPNLVKVEEHNCWVRFSAFANNPSIKLENWEALRNNTYQVGYLRGGKKVTEKLLQIVPTEQLTAIHTLEQATNLLRLNRIDIFVTFDIPMLSYLQSQDYQLKNSHISKFHKIYNIGPLEETTSHAWLHKSHSRLAPVLSKVLRDMKAEGLFQHYSEQLGAPPGMLKW